MDCRAAAQAARRDIRDDEYPSDSDELLVIHDGEDDPITEREGYPESNRLILASEPEYCSGKANAIAAEMRPHATTASSGRTTR